MICMSHKDATFSVYYVEYLLTLLSAGWIQALYKKYVPSHSLNLTKQIPTIVLLVLLIDFVNVYWRR